MNEERLKDVPLFASLSKRQRREVASHADEVDVPEGKKLMSEGEFAYEFCVIEKGTATVLYDDKPVAELGPGDFAGEMGALSHARRNATVAATAPMTLIVMTDRDLREINNSMPSVASQLRAKIEERTRALSG